ncbi:MAG: hypothetical protein WBB24_07725, partial [Maribacter sp.]
VGGIILLICFFAHKIKVVLLQILQSYKYTEYPMEYEVLTFWGVVSYQQKLWKIGLNTSYPHLV